MTLDESLAQYHAIHALWAVNGWKNYIDLKLDGDECFGFAPRFVMWEQLARQRLDVL